MIKKECIDCNISDKFYNDHILFAISKVKVLF
jgi:hypothetical protein